MRGGGAYGGLERRLGTGGADCLTSAGGEGGLSFKGAPLRDRAATA